ncbi:MAG: WecB/TagA/CpsF family glycosyltransferase [Spirochaetales bacterium]|nr:WecB/TagA/CpsF family glycosyltransferase [Spirochaetales bacterium]
MIQIKRKSFLGIPVDSADPESAYNAIEGFLQDGKKHQIVLLTIDKLLKARVDPEYNRCIREASLILPVSSGIIHGARFHDKGELFRYNPYEFLIKLFMILEKYEKTVYLLGSRKEYLMEAEKNLKVSFHGLKIIGRFAGFFNKEMERKIILTIKKSSPALLIVGKGVPGKEKWIYRNKNEFNPGICFWIDNFIEIFSGTEKNISKRMFQFGLESLPGVFKKPWKLFKIFPFLYFKILVLIYKILGY